MDILWDITRGKLVKAVGSATDPDAINLKYRGWYPVRVFIIEDNAKITTELAGTPTITLGIKQAEKFDAQFFAETSDWTWNSTDHCYEGEISLTSTVLRDAILDNADASDDELVIESNIELQYYLDATPAKVVKHEGYLSATVQNCVIRGDEDDVIESGSVYRRYLSSVTGLTGGGATNLDGALSPTAVNVGSIVELYISSVPQLWRLFSGTDAENSAAGVVRPDNFHATTNPVVWKQIA